MATDNPRTPVKPHTNAFRDLVILIGAIILILCLSFFFDAFSLIVDFLGDYPEKITFVDEAIAGLLTVAIGLAIFSWRRWREVKKETAARIAQQTEMLRMTETQAQTEKIISRQLRSDMEQLKDDVHTILLLLNNKKN